MTPKKQKKNNPVKAAKWLWRFLTHDIWSYTNDDVRGIYRWLMNVFKSLFLSIRFFISDHIIEKASALTYYTLLALVPIVALLIGIANGFGLQSYIRMSLQSLMPGQQETIDYLFTFASNYLEHTKTGVVMGIGVVMLIYVIYSLIGNVETVFNQIWQQKKGRTTLRKITDYLCEWIMGSWPWQTYADYKYNFQARIALSPSIRFGIGGVAFLYVIQPLLDILAKKLKDKPAKITAIVIISVLALDLLYTIFLR